MKKYIYIFVITLFLLIAIISGMMIYAHFKEAKIQDEGVAKATAGTRQGSWHERGCCGGHGRQPGEQHSHVWYDEGYG